MEIRGSGWVVAASPLASPPEVGMEVEIDRKQEERGLVWKTTHHIARVSITLTEAEKAGLKAANVMDAVVAQLPMGGNHNRLLTYTVQDFVRLGHLWIESPNLAYVEETLGEIKEQLVAIKRAATAGAAPPTSEKFTL
jgi:hypothetical protein